MNRLHYVQYVPILAITFLLYTHPKEKKPYMNFAHRCVEEQYC